MARARGARVGGPRVHRRVARCIIRPPPYCCKLNFKQIYESEPVGDVGGRRRCSKKNGFLILFCAHYRSYGARQSSSIISKNRVLRLDERSSVILVGKPIAQTLESNKAMEWSPSGATPSKDGDGVEWDGGRLRVCERRSLKTEQWRMAYVHWSDPATFPKGDQLPAHYRAMALPSRKWEDVRRYGCMSVLDLDRHSKWPGTARRLRLLEGSLALNP